jgi:hypothetical protein
VRDELWELAVNRAGVRGSVMQIWSSPTPQGYAFRSHNTDQRCLVDHEGLALVRVRREKREKGLDPAEDASRTEPGSLKTEES